MAAVKCYVRKARVFRCSGIEREKPEPCVGFYTTKGKTCFVFYFPISHLLVFVLLFCFTACPDSGKNGFFAHNT